MWLKYSDGQFGFSVQAQILNSIKSNPDLTDDEKSRKYARLNRKLSTWHDLDNIPEKFNNSLINPHEHRGYLPSRLWASYAPLPNSLNIIKPLRKLKQCINPKFTQ